MHNKKLRLTASAVDVCLATMRQVFCGLMDGGPFHQWFIYAKGEVFEGATPMEATRKFMAAVQIEPEPT